LIIIYMCIKNSMTFCLSTILYLVLSLSGRTGNKARYNQGKALNNFNFSLGNINQYPCEANLVS